MTQPTPVCPLLSLRHPSVDALCLESDCALYLPPAKKCSLVYIGFKAMMDIQRMQSGPHINPPGGTPKTTGQ